MLAATAVVALGLVLGAGPSAAVDDVAPPAVTATTEPATTEPAPEPAPEPTATEPATTEPAATEPATTEPAATEPATTEPAATEPATTEPAVTEPAAAEPAATTPTPGKKVSPAGPSAAFLVAPGAICPTTAQVAGSSTPGGFEIDGNCQSNGALDWESPQTGNQPVANDMLLGAGDTTEFIANAGKTDIQYVYAFGHGDAAAVWLNFGFTRDKATGSVRYELELNQAPANTGPGNPVPARTAGDYLFDITQGGNGAFALNSVQRWTGTAWGAPFGTVGVVATADAAGFFFEISLNLTTLTGVTTSCPPSALFTTVNLRTQASTSANSSFADYIGGLTIPPPSNCPTLTLNKNVVGGTAAASAWTLTAQADSTVPASLRTVSGPTGVTGSVVPAKAYALSESGPAAYTGSLWTCPGATVSGPLGSQTVTVGIADVTCTITNTATSTLTVQKTNPAGDALSGATFVLHSGSAAGPTVGSCTTTSPSGTCSVSGLGFGSYYWVETVAPPGYVLPTGAAAVFGPVVVDAANAGQVIAATVVADVPQTHLTLVKTVSNTFGGTAAPSAWTLTATGPTTGVTGATGSAAVTNVVVTPGNYALSESGPSGYAGTWSCSGASLGAGDQVSLSAGQTATCTVNNSDLPAHLTLIKTVVNVFGGTSIDLDWTLTATGPTMGVTGITGSAAVTSAPVIAGTYTLSESGPSGYAGTWSCTGATFTAPNQVTLALGQPATCTITNTDQPAHLTLLKVVTNSWGGTSVVGDWTLTATGPTAGVSGTSGATAVTNAEVSAGTYTLSESGPTGYAGTWSCPFASFTAPNQVSLALGQSITCTVTNVDRPAALQLTKLVTNAYGGTAVPADWTVTATQQDPAQGAPAVTVTGQGSASGSVPSGEYLLSEAGAPIGYTASAWTCTGGTVVANVVTVPFEGSVSCSITNADRPAELELTKIVTNAFGGTAVAANWTVTATQQGVNGGQAVTVTGQGSASGPVPAGQYLLVETGGPSGYTASAWTCTGGTVAGSVVTVPFEGTVACSITNADRPASLQLSKSVTNSFGGTSVPADWTLTATQQSPAAGVPPVVVTGQGTASGSIPSGQYVLTESGDSSHYTPSAWTCTGGTVVGNVVTVPWEGSVSCSITNADLPASLQLSKTVTNTSGGTSFPGDWTLTATQQGVSPGQAVTVTGQGTATGLVPAGDYLLEESGGLAGYNTIGWTCTGGTVVGSVVTVPFEGSVSCSITNTDAPPHLSLTKIVTNNFGGTSVPADWTVTATQQRVNPNNAVTISGQGSASGQASAGTYLLTESGGLPGYTASDWACQGGSLDGAVLTLVLGQSAECSITNTDKPAHLTLVKEVVNANGGTAPATAWTLSADGPTPFSGQTGANAAVAAGTYTLSESGPPGYSASEWVCVGGALDGASLTLSLDESAVCTITNTDMPAHLTLVKEVVNANGGTAPATAWTLTASGPTAGVSGTTGSAAVTGAAVNAGTYTLSESGPSGYAASAWVCTAGTLNGAQLTLALNQTASCTITNTDMPAHLTLVKEVVNANGGTAPATAWILRADGPTLLSGPTGATGAVDAGTYTLSETGPAGYAASAWVCTAGILAGAELTLALNQTATCTITNTDLPAHLTLVKEVVNANGGTAPATAWTLTATGPTAGVSGITGAAALTGAAVDAGTYTLSESGPSGYAASTWVCEGGVLDGAQLTLALNATATCTITNTDLPAHLTLVKNVVNANGGTAPATSWTLTATGPTLLSGPTGTTGPVDAGTYTLSESGPSGYAASAWVCTAGILDGAQLTLALNQTATCTVTNTDQPAHLTLVKEVVNANGGTALATDWTLSADGPTPMSGQTGTTGAVSAGTYTLSESGASGYAASAWACEGGVLDGASLTLGLDESAVCTITNTDMPAHLTLVKQVVNANGGTAPATAWTLTASGPTAGVSGTTGSAAVTGAAVDAGTYTLSESGPSGYSASAWVCTAGTLDGAQLTLGLNQSALCTITNTDRPAHLTLVKEVVNANGGTAPATAWTLTATGPTAGVSGITGAAAVTGAAVDAGTYTLSESGPSGYAASTWVCEGGVLDGAQLTLALNATATCTITNTDLPAHLTLVKNVVNANGGTAPATSWTLTATGPTAGVSGTTGSPAVTGAGVSAGTYTLSESGPSGYAASAWVCEGGVLAGAQLTLALNTTATCTVTNTDQPAHLTLVKEVVNENGGTQLATAWTLGADGPTPMSGQTGTTGAVAAGTYTLSETGPSGYDASAWACEGGALRGSTLTLALNESATCTIINTDLPAHLTLLKEVVNENGGIEHATAWTLSAAGPTPFSGVTGTNAVVSAGTYTLSESGPSGYDASAWACQGGALRGSTLTLALDESASCTIINTDQPANITLVAIVVNNYGGTAVAQDFTLTGSTGEAGDPRVSGITGQPSVTGAPTLAGVYSLSQTPPPAGHTVSGWACEGGPLTGSAVTLNLGGSVVCTIIYRDSPAHLTLIKKVVNGHGGTAVATDWTLSAVGPVTLGGTSGSPAVTGVATAAGDFELSEIAGPTGYTASGWVCVGGTLNGSTVTVAFVESATCTITNTQDAPPASPIPTVPPVVQAPPVLARTGADIFPMGLSSLIALALGAVLMVAGRRRERD